MKEFGQGFQYEIEDRIKSNGWEIFPPQSYMDPDEMKSRVIDIVASRRDVSYNARGNQLALVVECKNLSHDVKFWLRQNPKDKKAYFMDGYKGEDIFRAEEKFHFFCQDKVAMDLNESEGKKDMYGGIMQASKALLYLRQNPGVLYTKGFFYPVVVYRAQRSKICDENDNELKNIVYYHRYEWRDPKTQSISTRSLYVDIIHEDYLEDFLENTFKAEMGYAMKHVFYQNIIMDTPIKKPNNWI